MLGTACPAQSLTLKPWAVAELNVFVSFTLQFFAALFYQASQLFDSHPVLLVQKPKSHLLWPANNLLIDAWEQNKFVCVCWAPSESGSEEKKNRDFWKCLRLLRALKKF